jgi:hypothetical protein
MKKELEDALQRLIASPLRRAADPPPRVVSSLDSPICDMPDDQKLFTANIVLLWFTLGACACTLVEKMAKYADTISREDHAKALETLNMILDNMDRLRPVVDAVTKFGLKLALLNCQLDRADDALDDLEFAEQVAAEVTIG